jgi:predicted metal-binding membrane protein
LSDFIVICACAKAGYARVGRQAVMQGKPFANSNWFFGGYLLAWVAFALVATLA